MAEDHHRDSQDLGLLQARIREFARERDWEQFHSPKNLILALMGEVGELAEIVQWLTPEEAMRVMENLSSANRIREELADVLIYVVRLADVLGVDLVDVADAKLAVNRERYPVDRVQGSARKYTDL
jgi:NTP pyrophosphatase (non-canonical NTP hydrolase)